MHEYMQPDRRPFLGRGASGWPEYRPLCLLGSAAWCYSFATGPLREYATRTLRYGHRGTVASMRLPSPSTLASMLARTPYSSGDKPHTDPVNPNRTRMRRRKRQNKIKRTTAARTRPTVKLRTKSAIEYNGRCRPTMRQL
jgi:hypothetical protein